MLGSSRLESGLEGKNFSHLTRHQLETSPWLRVFSLPSSSNPLEQVARKAVKKLLSRLFGKAKKFEAHSGVCRVVDWRFTAQILCLSMNFRGGGGGSY